MEPKKIGMLLRWFKVSPCLLLHPLLTSFSVPRLILNTSSQKEPGGPWNRLFLTPKVLFLLLSTQIIPTRLCGLDSPGRTLGKPSLAPHGLGEGVLPFCRPTGCWAPAKSPHESLCLPAFPLGPGSPRRPGGDPVHCMLSGPRIRIAQTHPEVFLERTRRVTERHGARQR